MPAALSAHGSVRQSDRINNLGAGAGNDLICITQLRYERPQKSLVMPITQDGERENSNTDHGLHLFRGQHKQTGSLHADQFLALEIAQQPGHRLSGRTDDLRNLFMRE